MATQYVVIGGGSQLAEVIREERKYRQDGYVILPLANGTSDGYGMTTWLPKTFAQPTEFSTWEWTGSFYRKIRT